LSATGIAGTVDLRTVKPLDFSEDQVNLAARYVLNDNGQLNPDFADDGYRLFGSYIAVNDSQTAGFTLAVTHQSNPTQFLSRELKSNQFQVGQQDGVFFANDNPRSGVVSRDFERTSIAGTLQFEPTDRFRASADVLYSEYSDTGIFRGVETPLASWSGNSATNVTGAAGGFATSATYPLTPVILRTDTESNEVDTSAFGVNLQYDLTERLTVEADFSTSSLDRNDIDYESYAGLGRGIVGSGNEDVLSSLTFTTPENGAYSISDGRNLDYTDPNTVLLTDPGGWGQVGFVREPVVEDDLDQIRLEASYDLGNSVISDVAVGAIFTDREKTFDDNPRFLRPGLGFVDSSQPIPASIVEGVTDTGSLGLPIVAYDPESLLTNGTYILENTDSNIFDIQEEITTLYAIAEIDTQFGSVPVTGNVGLQYIDTEQGSGGIVNGANGREFLRVEDSYDSWLPSANFNFELMPDLALRLAYAKTETRPLFNDLAANLGVGFNNTVCVDNDGDGRPDEVIAPISAPNNLCFSAGGGNPFLRPYASDSYDVSVEKYFGPSSAIVLAGFYKDLSDYIQGGNEFVDGTDIINGFGAGDLLASNPEASLISLGGPFNTDDGSIKGVEAQIRVSLGDFISASAIDGFGFNGSYGYTDAEVERENGEFVNIPGYSEQTAQGEVYYEKYGFRARVSANYRSSYQANVFLFDGSAFGARALGRTTIDGQIGYEFDSGPLEGLSLNVEAYNLSDEPFRTEEDFSGNGDTFISRREDYGRTFNFTVAKKF
jgi:iron complex outermembrane receptor protein